VHSAYYLRIQKSRIAKKHVFSNSPSIIDRWWRTDVHSRDCMYLSNAQTISLNIVLLDLHVR
jgi:hypothetical protein